MLLSEYKIIIFSIDHLNPLGLLRSLGEKQQSPILILVSKHPLLLTKSRYATIIHQVASIEDGYDLLLEKYGQEKNKPFVLGADDKIVSYLDAHYNNIKDKFTIYNGGDENRLQFLMDKGNIAKLAQSVGLSIPNSQVVQTGTLPNTLKYPIITKTLSSTMGAWKKDVFVCRNETELLDAYKKIKSPMLILQEFIKKKGEVALQGFSINDGNDVFMPFKCEYIRYYSESYGHYMKFSPFNDEALINKIHALFKKTRFNGIFEVEFMKNENDELLFLEINLRPSAWNYAMTFGGANLPYFWMKSVLAGKIVSEEINLRKTPYTAMSELDDFTNNVIHGKLSLFTWLKEFIKCDCTYLSNKSDRKPMANLLLTLFKNKFIK